MSSYDFDGTNDTPGRPGRGAFRLAAIFAFLCIAAMGGLAVFGTFDHDEPSKLGLFIGRFHPVIVHLPIGGLALIITLEILSLLTARKWKPRTLAPLVFTAIAAVAAVACGYLLGSESPASEVTWHFRWGIIASALILITLVLRVASARGSTAAGLLSAVTILGSVGAMTIAGHLGATITHGPTYMTQYAPESIKPTMEKLLGLETPPKRTPDAGDPAGEQDDDDAATDADQSAISDDPNVDVVQASFMQRDLYADFIQPILVDRCGSCHGEGRQRARLRVTDHASILAGGSSGPAVVAGDADSSVIIERIELPEESFDRMPPGDRAQLTADEIAAIRIWVTAGAPEAATIASLNIADASLAVLMRLDQENLPSEDLQQQGGGASADDQASLPSSAGIEQRIRTINEKIGGGLRQLARNSADLVFTAATQSRTFTDEQLAVLTEHAGGELVELDLSFTAITPDGIAAMKPMPRLRKLTLSHTELDDPAVAAVAKNAPNLETLIVFNTKVTDVALESLKECVNLQQVYLGQTQVTADAARQLEELHGKLTCVGDWDLPIAEANGKDSGAGGEPPDGDVEAGFE